MNHNCKTIFIDIDDTICYYNSSSNKLDYSLAIPNFKYIDIINDLYDSGHYIVLWSSRGVKTGIDWYDITIKQLENWNVKYHKLKLDKPVYDLFIDDKSINNLNQFNLVKNFFK